MTPLWRDLDISVGNTDLRLFNTRTIRCLFLSLPSGLSSLEVNCHGLLQASSGQDLLKRISFHQELCCVKSVRTEGQMVAVLCLLAKLIPALQGHGKKQGAHGKAAYLYLLCKRPTSHWMWICSRHISERGMCNKSLLSSSLALAYLYHGYIYATKHSSLHLHKTRYCKTFFFASMPLSYPLDQEAILALERFLGIGLQLWFKPLLVNLSE